MPRESKFTTDELKEVISQFIDQGQHQMMKMNYKNLADFAKNNLELGGISYYHFSRNGEIKEIIKGYSKTLKQSNLELSGDNKSFTKLNVREFVKLNSGKPDQLIFFLTKLQESQQSLYQRTIRTELKNKDLENQLKTALGKNIRIKEKYKELQMQFEELKERSLVLAEALNREEEKQFISALKSTEVILIKREEEVAVAHEDISKLEEQKDLENLLNEYSDIFD
ncbi:hypothetical protein [Sutcliffiella sp. NC1]|uniref:hypothetical protein n=1 Tax=Sutcliffiella sp. NC1 TaxID=3004096 RepID=UPI0022DDB445|nr:hypothetical protein [Sutcliffiella sp. NC1]WBL15222.1 hypothetical protein O1A01_00595 [Sutcliffiella sp. NC1]